MKANHLQRHRPADNLERLETIGRSGQEEASIEEVTTRNALRLHKSAENAEWVHDVTSKNWWAWPGSIGAMFGAVSCAGLWWLLATDERQDTKLHEFPWMASVLCGVFTFNVVRGSLRRLRDFASYEVSNTRPPAIEELKEVYKDMAGWVARRFKDGEVSQESWTKGEWKTKLAWRRLSLLKVQNSLERAGFSASVQTEILGPLIEALDIAMEGLKKRAVEA